MATGGTIPNNRSQSVTFYDTTGIIERHKNIYYAPLFEEAGDTDIRNAYLSRFNEVCPPSSAYTDIDISSWSPQDRTLVVRGNIDDFRLVTDEGACLNYFIITRRITKGESVETYYYGFFITGVSQAGGSSITITAEPDDFTNVFYLHNRDSLTVGYDPFNKKMSNCYVNRQHYDRVEVTQYQSVYNSVIYSSRPLLINVNDIVNIQFIGIEESVDYGNFKVLSINIYQNNYSIKLLDLQNRKTVSIPLTFISLSVLGGTSYPASLSQWNKNIEESTYDIHPKNTKIFLNQEESFKYKYQYRNFKYPICSSEIISNFTSEEQTLIEQAEALNELSTELRNKVLLTALMYVCIETKSLERLMPYKYQLLSDEYKLTAGNLEGGLNTPNARILFPLVIFPKKFKHLETNVSFDFTFSAPNTYKQGNINIEDGISVLRKLNKKASADFIYGAYLINDACVPTSRISISLQGTNSYKISFSLDLVGNNEVNTNYDDVSFKQGLYFVGLQSNPTVNPYININNTETTGAMRKYVSIDDADYNFDNFALGIVNSGYNYKSLILRLTDNIPDLINNYYDIVLESDPYSFYTISFLSGYELDFKKARYFVEQTNDIYLDYFYSINGMLKIGFIPRYTVDDYETRYYNEGLTFTLTPQLPLVSDSYSSFYYQNMAQMKNQFAVNDFNRGVDLLQHFFVSGPNAVGYSASRRGGYGALAETGNQLMEMLNEGIDWGQSKKEIAMNQKAKLADMGAKPDTLKQVGSEVYYDLKTGEYSLFLNHYTIDELSYNSIAKLLERTGYQVNLYDELHTYDRVGWNFIKLNGFDWKPDVNIMVSQEESIRTIFINGVTLLHDKNFLTSGHNYERILKE